MTRKAKRITGINLDPARQGPLTRKQREQLAALSRMREREIDYSDIPRIPAVLLERAGRTQLYRPVKRQLSVRIDADVLAWLKSQGKGYQTRINGILRSAMMEEQKSG